MPAHSLVTLCTNACIRNIRNLTDVGDIEYWKIRSVLAKVPTAEQLHQIELASPQIQEEDAELWKALIARDINNWQSKNYVPKNPKKWYQVYKKYKQEQQEEISRDEARLREQMAALQKQKATNVSKVVSAASLPKLPKEPRMFANDGGVPISLKKKAPVGGSRRESNGRGQSKGTSVMRRALREAKEMSARLQINTSFERPQRSQVLKAPQGMIEQYRREAASEQPRIFAPRRTTTVRPFGPSRTPGEERLLAIRDTGSSPPKSAEKRTFATIVDDSSDDEASDDVADLFNERLSASESASPPPAKKAKLDEAPKPVKPSEFISSLISKPKPIFNAKTAEKQSAKESIMPSIEARASPAPLNLKRTGPAGFRTPTPPTKAPAGFRLSPTSESGPAASSSKPVIIRKRAKVDIFNRAASTAKKPAAK